MEAAGIPQINLESKWLMDGTEMTRLGRDFKNDGTQQKKNDNQTLSISE